MRVLAFLSLIVVVAVSGCVAMEPYAAVTPSGRPEAVFEHATTSDIGAKLALRCLDAGLIIQDQSPNLLTCGGQLTGGDAIAAQLLIGNAYSTPPVQTIRFNLVQVGDSVRVQAFQQVQTQYAFGQVRSLELNAANQFNVIQYMFEALGGHAPGEFSTSTDCEALTGNEYARCFNQRATQINRQR